MSTAVPQFSPSLGTLESVEITYKSTITADWAITNPGGSSVTGTFNTTVDIALTTSGDLINQSNDQTTGDVAFDVGPHKTKDDDKSDHGTSDLTYTSAEILSQFTGAGTLELTETTSATNMLNPNSGSPTYTASSTADATGSVIYTFLAAPEPSSLVLVTIGTLSILAFGIRLRKSPSPSAS